MSYTREDVAKRYEQASKRREDVVCGKYTFEDYWRAAEESISWERVLRAIDAGLDPTVAVLNREVRNGLSRGRLVKF